MRGVNKVIILGNLGRDPEARYTPAGTAITTFSVATSESWKDKQTGEQQERTEWHRVKMFGKIAEIAAEYLKKGSQVYIEGKIRTEEYEKDGVKKFATYVIGEQMTLLGGRDGGSEERKPAQQRQGRPVPAPERAEFDDDEIPF